MFYFLVILVCSYLSLSIVRMLKSGISKLVVAVLSLILIALLPVWLSNGYFPFLQMVDINLGSFVLSFKIGKYELAWVEFAVLSTIITLVFKFLSSGKEFVNLYAFLLLNLVSVLMVVIGSNIITVAFCAFIVSLIKFYLNRTRALSDGAISASVFVLVIDLTVDMLIFCTLYISNSLGNTGNRYFAIAIIISLVWREFIQSHVVRIFSHQKYLSSDFSFKVLPQSLIPIVYLQKFAHGGVISFQQLQGLGVFSLVLSAAFIIMALIHWSKIKSLNYFITSIIFLIISMNSFDVGYLSFSTTIILLLVSQILYVHLYATISKTKDERNSVHSSDLRWYLASIIILVLGFVGFPGFALFSARLDAVLRIVSGTNVSLPLILTVVLFCAQSIWLSKQLASIIVCRKKFNLDSAVKYLNTPQVTVLTFLLIVFLGLISVPSYFADDYSHLLERISNITTPSVWQAAPSKGYIFASLVVLLFVSSSLSVFSVWMFIKMFESTKPMVNIFSRPKLLISAWGNTSLTGRLLKFNYTRSQIFIDNRPILSSAYMDSFCKLKNVLVQKIDQLLSKDISYKLLFGTTVVAVVYFVVNL